MRWVCVAAMVACEGKQLGFGMPIAEGALFPTDCVATADCALVPVNGPCECGCDLRAISADAEPDFWAWYLEQDDHCTPPACSPCAQPAVRAVCSDGVCATETGPGGGFGGFTTPPGGSGGALGY